MIDRRNAWVSVSKYVDIETGEQITKETALREYEKINTIKKINYESKYIEYTNEFRRTNQLKLW